MSKEFASALFAAKRNGQSITRFTAKHPKFNLEDALQVQRSLFALHEKAGEKLAGYKMGLTSRPKMQQMGVNEPISGFLTNAMQIQDGGEISLKGRIHPKIEPEIAFLMKRELRGRPSVAEALNAVDGVCAALDILDSRYSNFEFQLPDVVADNASSSGFMVGSKLVKASALDLGNLGILLEVNGKAQVFGSSAAILGHPGRSLAALAAVLDKQGLVIPAGSFVLAGAATAAIPLQAGSWVRGCFQGLGTLEARVIA